MRATLARTLVLLLIGLGMSGLSAAPPKKVAAKPEAPAQAAAPPVEESKGMDINGVCAACHGEFGQGGKRGEYPRRRRGDIP